MGELLKSTHTQMVGWCADRCEWRGGVYVYIFWVSPVSSVLKGLFTGGPGACLLAASVLDCNW